MGQDKRKCTNEILSKTFQSAIRKPMLKRGLFYCYSILFMPEERIPH